MKFIISVILTTISIFLLMHLLVSLNKGNYVLNIAALFAILIIGYIAVKTNLFTKFKFKKDEKDS